MIVSRLVLPKSVDERVWFTRQPKVVESAAMAIRSLPSSNLPTFTFTKAKIKKHQVDDHDDMVY